MTTSYADAWADYLAALGQARIEVEADPICADSKVRAAALYLPTQMQAVAFHMYLAPSKTYPQLYHQQIYSPFELCWGMPNPDYVYRFGFLDGRRRYRLSGPRRSPAPWFNLQLFTGWWGDPVIRELAEVELNDRANEAGEIEIFFGPEKLRDSDILLDPGEMNNVINIREAMEDWDAQNVTPLRLECVDEGGRGPFTFSEAEQVERLIRAAEMVRGTVRRTLRNHRRILEAAGGENRFFADVPMAERAQNNANLAQTMVTGLYNVPPGQSLIIETEMPRQARYWGIQLADLWWRTADWVYHQSSLNRTNAHFGPDGLFRAIVSHEDPGIQNWLDPVDNDRGQMIFRLNQASTTPLPRTRLVPSTEVRQHLPADIPHFTADQRREQIARRTAHAQRRYAI